MTGREKLHLALFALAVVFGVVAAAFEQWAQVGVAGLVALGQVAGFMAARKQRRDERPITDTARPS